MTKTVIFFKIALTASIFVLISCGGAKIPYFPEDNQEPEKKTEEKFLPIQKKYAKILGISVEEADRIKLYKFIDSWKGTPYRMGGENRTGIDCSFFSQFLYHDVYNSLIERTAEKQYAAPDTNKFIGQEYLQEGDLLFFNLSGSQYEQITHVGVYIGYDKFVHSTSRRTTKGNNGVQISNLKDVHWQKLFVAAGRKPNLNK